MRDESTIERCTVQILRQGLRAHVLAGALAGKNMAATWPRAELLLSSDQLFRKQISTKVESFIVTC